MARKFEKVLGFGMALALAGIMSGCGQAGSTVVVDAQEAAHAITVAATSQVEVVPDKVSFGVSISSTADEARDAQQANDDAVNAVVARLQELGVARESIQTSYTWLNPSWTWDEETGEEQMSGYEAYTRLDVRDVSVEDGAALMRACVEAGATGVDGPSYYSSSYDEAYEEALKAAVEASRPKAEAIAQASGVSLGQIIGVTEGWQDTSLRYAMTEEAAMDVDALDAGAAIADLEPGQVTVEASVTVSYAIG